MSIRAGKTSRLIGLKSLFAGKNVDIFSIDILILFLNDFILYLIFCCSTLPFIISIFQVNSQSQMPFQVLKISLLLFKYLQITGLICQSRNTKLITNFGGIQGGFKIKKNHSPGARVQRCKKCRWWWAAAAAYLFGLDLAHFCGGSWPEILLPPEPIHLVLSQAPIHSDPIRSESKCLTHVGRLANHRHPFGGRSW